MHVVLHLVHFSRGLDRNAAGIEGDALADEHDRCGAFFAAIVFEYDEFRWQVRGFRHGKEGVHTQLFHVLFLEDGAFEFVCLGQVFGGACQIRGGGNIWRQIAKVFSETHTFADSFTTLDGSTQGFLVHFAIQMEGNRLADIFIVGFALHLVKAVRTFDGEDGRLFNLPGDVGRCVFGVQGNGYIGCGRFFQGLERR